MQSRLSAARAFCADADMSRVQALLEMGMQLLVTAKRFKPDSRTRANCVDGAKRCQLRVEEELWRFKESSEIAQVTAGLDLLNTEILALG
jgi:hypothetical protein